MEHKTGKGVGASVRRKEDRRHLHGQGQFVSDIRVPGILDVAFVRSPVAHGIIKDISIPEDVRDKVFTAADFPGVKPIIAVPKVEGFKYSEHPPLATDRVRFAGEPIAMAIAKSRGEAEDIADSVFVDIDELPAVVDMLAATKPGAYVRREEWGDNVYVEEGNEYGDLEWAKQNAAVTVTRLGETSMTTELRLEREGETVTEGGLRHVFVTAGEGEKVPIPDTVREGLAPYAVTAA